MENDGGVKQLKKMVILAQEGLQKRNAELVDIVIKHPDIYVFGEFIDSPVITALKGGEFDESYKLLELFAYGNYADYKSCSDAIKKKVSADALNKLKKLTIVDLAGKQKVLHYAGLMSTLDVKTARELEDLLIDSIFAGLWVSVSSFRGCIDPISFNILMSGIVGLVKGNLDPRGQKFDVLSCFGRDVRVSHIESMTNKLASWSALSSDMVRMLDKEAAKLQASKEQIATKQSELAATALSVAEAVKQQEDMARTRKQRKNNMMGPMGGVGGGGMGFMVGGIGGMGGMRM